MKAKIVENFINASSRCNFSHPLTERPLPFGSSLHVKVRVEQDKIEVSLQQVKASFSKLWNFSAVCADAITILGKTNQAIRFPYMIASLCLGWGINYRGDSHIKETGVLDVSFRG